MKKASIATCEMYEVYDVICTMYDEEDEHYCHLCPGRRPQHGQRELEELATRARDEDADLVEQVEALIGACTGLSGGEFG